MFDYHTKTMNKIVYGQEEPPKINLENLSLVPIAFISAIQDKYVDLEINRKYAEEIPTVFTHLEID